MPGELERLKERVQKDPSSRLFIPLADELRKAGMREEAVQVLRDGLERQPDYMSARVALGKLYLEEDNLEGAIAEFRRVADAIPDNLFAQRKLAEIHLRLGDLEDAKKAFEIVIRLNPMDLEAKKTLERLNGVNAADENEAPGEAPAEAEPPAEEPMAVAPEPPVANPAPEAEGKPDFGTGESPGDLRIDDGTSEAGESPGAEGPNESESPARGQAAEGPAAAEEDLAGWFEENSEGVREEDGEIVIESGADNVIEDDVLKDNVIEDGAIAGGEADETAADALSAADALIGEGEYARGLLRLRRHLELYPEDIQALQRHEELRMLIKLLGIEGDVKVSMLGAFLESAKRKKDDFFRGP